MYEELDEYKEAFYWYVPGPHRLKDLGSVTTADIIENRVGRNKDNEELMQQVVEWLKTFRKLKTCRTHPWKPAFEKKFGYIDKVFVTAALLNAKYTYKIKNEKVLWNIEKNLNKII